MKPSVRKLFVMLLIASLCLGILTSISWGQSVGFSPESQESLDVTLFMSDEGGGLSQAFLENLVITFVNATEPPLNTSVPAFRDSFENARFSVVFGSRFSLFLRVSYNATLDSSTADVYADDVLGEFRRALNLSLDVTNKTQVVNTEEATLDVYFHLSDLEQELGSFGQLAKFVPSDGFGLLVDKDLLGMYVPSSSDNNVYLLEYTLTRIDQLYTWRFNLELGHKVWYMGDDNVNVSFDELLNRSGLITPSTHRYSSALVYIYKKEYTHNKTPLVLSLNSSSPPYTTFYDGNDYVTLIYNLTYPNGSNGPLDNIIVRVNVGLEAPSLNLIYLAIIVSVACIALVVVLVFVRAHRRKLRKTESMENLR
jgi:hypothetical protein